MSTTKPALLRAFAKSFASPYHDVTQKPIFKKHVVPKTSRKVPGKVNKDDVLASLKGKASFASSFVYVVQRTCSKHLLCLFLSAKFCKENKLENNTLVDLTIHGVVDKHWVVEFVYHDHSNYKRKAIMHNGFQEFIEDNDLKEGDELIFHLMPCTLGNTTRPWLQVFIKNRLLCPSNNQTLDQVGDQVFFPKVCNVMNHHILPSTPRIVIRSPQDPTTQETKPPVERSYKLIFNGKLVRHFLTLEYNS